MLQGKASPEYSDPAEFFRRTYLTEGLQELLITGINRLTSNGGDPVVQLQTSFGGGKTHSMLAMYHLCGGDIRFEDIFNEEDLLQRVGKVDDRLSASRAVIVGTAFDPTVPRRYADCTTHTLWGEIAYQLGGVAAYRMVETADLTATSPGSDTLFALLDQFGPALIIIDELVAYARNLYGVTERLASGTFESVMTFVQSLTEAVKRSSDALLLVSIPQSEIEVGGEGGQQTLRILSNTIGRVESIWKPVTANESFEIVRRRLFSSDMDYPARDATVNAFTEMYRQNPTDYPRGVGEADYGRRMKAAYPIHPELFDRLYEDWSTLENFQRTRGVLRLMATVIHKLWQENDQSLMIMPSSIPLWNSEIRNEILRYFPERQNWSAIVETDIDGENAKPSQIDRNIPVLGQHFASRRVARSIFMGSAPSVVGQAVRGVDENHLHLAVVQPGERVGTFNDALRRMTNELTYLYSDNTRYWYDTRPTVNRVAQERAEAIPEDDLYQEAERRLRATANDRSDFSAVHIAPHTSADVTDDERFRAVVFSPRYAYNKSDPNSPALIQAKSFLENRGQTLRLNKNVLIFIVADESEAKNWLASIREYLAWKSIEADKETLNLDLQQMRQVSTSLSKAEQNAQARLLQSYAWLIVPTQENPLEAISYPAHRIKGNENFYSRALQKLQENEWLIRNWAPENLQQELQRYLWRDSNHVNTLQLWEYFTRYCYLPRLLNKDVLKASLERGIASADAPFGYAPKVEGDTYKGIVLGKPTSIVFDNEAVIVRPEIARDALSKLSTPVVTPPSDPIATVERSMPIEARGSSDKPMIPTPSPTLKQRKTRYHGSVSLDPQRANHDMGNLVKEVIQHLTGLTATDVEITLEIRATRSEGFDEQTMRTVNENSRTLKFTSHGFEDR